MLFKLNTHSKHALLIFLGLIILYFFVPKNFFDYGYFGFSLIIVTPIIVLWRVLKYLHINNNMEYEFLKYDFLVFDLLYMLALPILYTVLMARLGRPLWHLKYIGEIYYIVLSIIVILKILSINKSRHAGIARFSILILFPLVNLLAINQIYTLWYIWQYLSWGYR